ncbi:MAG: murein biosynthesis integral membrane protein MurJ, partial [Phycisphaerae bacterium]|nr:murein biosynthesis integral membrane protein MurJ [Phycisphaerae bacterium]
GEFTLYDANETSFALYFYAIGIVPVAASRILVSVFYSLKDTRTPVVFAAGTFFVN